MKCKICGSELKDGAKFCENCGAKAEIEETVENTASVENTEGKIHLERVEGQIVSEPPKMENPAYESANDTNTAQSQNNGGYAERVSGETFSAGSQGAGGAASHSYSENVSGSVNYSNKAPESKGFAIASLVCGILSLVCCCCTPLSVILGGVGVGLGIYVLYSNLPGREMAIAGIACGGVGLVIFLFSLIISATGAFHNITDSLDMLDLDDIMENL